MNKMIQLIIGFIFIGLSIGILVYIFLKVLPSQSITSSSSTIKIFQSTDIIDAKLVETIKKQNKPASIPVTVGEGEASRDNPFANY